MELQKDVYSSFLGEHITANREVKVWSTSIGEVIYALDDPNVRRNWKPGEVKVLTFHELYQLSKHPGGMSMLANNLQIREMDIREALELPLEPEYLYTEEDARRLVNKGSNDEIYDALEFGPRSLAAMIRYYAILDVDSVERMRFFNGLFQMNIQQIRDNMIETEEKAEAATPTRRVKIEAPVAEIDSAKASSKRRTSETLTPSEPAQQEPTEE